MAVMTTHNAKPLFVVVALAVVVLSTAVGLAQPKGTTVTIKGEAVDLWC
jgi:hypothetical protein